jgi:hypothetical protein
MATKSDKKYPLFDGQNFNDSPLAAGVSLELLKPVIQDVIYEAVRALDQEALFVLGHQRMALFQEASDLGHFIALDGSLADHVCGSAKSIIHILADGTYINKEVRKSIL